MAKRSILPAHIQLYLIAEIGELFLKDFVNHMTFLSDDYILDADVLLISITSLQLEFTKLMDVKNVKDYYMPKNKLEAFQNKVLQRKKQLEQYLERGGVLFVFIDNDPIYKFRLDNGEDTSMDFREILLLNPADFKIDQMRGTNIIYPDPEYLNFFDAWDVSYNFVYNKFKGIATAKVKNTNQAVSVALPHGRGMIFLLPDLKLSADDHNDYENRLFDARLAILNFVDYFERNKPQVVDVNLPDWCNDYYLGDEHQDVETMQKLRDELAEVQRRIDSQQEQLDTYKTLKQALSGTGKPLEGIIELLFKEFGFELLPTEPGRDDLIIKANEQIGVVEIKGVKGSASEQNATQLMKWVNNYHHENNVEPKGILIVNAFKDLAPDLRKEEAFPHQMIAYATRMQFCLITTYQLLGIYLDFKAGVLSFTQIENMLFHTNGRMDYKPSRIIHQPKTV